MITYTLQRPIEPLRAKDGREMVPGVEEVKLRHPKARAFVELEKAGAFKTGNDLQAVVGLAKAIVADASIVVDDLWIGDIRGIVKAGEAAGFFPSEEEAEPTRMDRLEKRIATLEERLSR